MSHDSNTTDSDKKLPDRQQSLIAHVDKIFGDSLKRREDLAWREYGLQYELDSNEPKSVFRTLKDHQSLLFNMLVDVTAVDWLDSHEMRFEVIYHLLSITFNTRICIRIRVSESEPKVESVRSLWPAANFLEREVWDMFGVEFDGHGDLRRIMMYEEFVGHPLRKDYPVTAKQPRVELRIPELQNTSARMNKEQLVALPVRQRMSKGE